MNKYAQYWDKKLPENKTKATYTPWLDKYFDKMPKDLPILDLGCGNGEDTEYLIGNGYGVLSVDFSQSAIEHISEINENARIFDISNPEDWAKLKDHSFGVVVADLSLHYFDDKTTRQIMQEIKRVLVPNGVLIARVNSASDLEFGAESGEQIEENFYANKERGINKRFFTEDSAKDYFSIVGDCEVSSQSITYLGKHKEVFEVVATTEMTLKQSNTAGANATELEM